MPSHTRNPQRGFTLVEMSIAMIVVGLAATAMMSAYRSTEQAAREREYIQHFVVMDKAIRQAHQSGDYTGLSAASVIASGAVPEKYISRDKNGGVEIVSPVGVPVAVAAVNLTGRVAGTAYQIAYADVPAAECSALRGALTGVVDEVEIPVGFRNQAPCSSASQSVTIRSR